MSDSATKRAQAFLTLARPEGRPVKAGSPGYFGFHDAELPEHIGFGADQKLAVHELLGGGRVVDALGAQPKDLEWSGLFLGANALARALELEALCRSGEPLDLSWQTMNFRVFVAAFTADFLLACRIPYTINLAVVQDLSVAPPPVPVPDADATIQSDMADFLEWLDAMPPYTPDSLRAPLAVVQQKSAVCRSVMGDFGSGANALGSFSNLTSSAAASILTPLHDLRQAQQQLLAQVENTLQQLATVGGLVPRNRVAQQVAALNDSINLCNASATLVQMDGALGRVGNNVAAVPAATRTVTTSADLFTVAREQYGDASAWTTIARANGLSDPQLPGITTLNIPPAPDASGGVLHA